MDDIVLVTVLGRKPADPAATLISFKAIAATEGGTTVGALAFSLEDFSTFFSWTGFEFLISDDLISVFLSLLLVLSLGLD